MFHKLLVRQLERAGIAPEKLPADTRQLLRDISEEYQRAETDRVMVERSLDLTSQEFVEINARLRRELQDRKRFQRVLQLSYEVGQHFQFMMDASTDLISLIDRDHRYRAVNLAFHQAHQRQQGSLVGLLVEEVWGRRPYLTAIRPRLEETFGGREVEYEVWLDLPAHGKRLFNVRMYPYRNGEEVISHVVVFSRDITDHRLLLDRFNHSQKMDTLGRMAGGVAHDFNNLLTVISGYINFVKGALPPGDARVDDLDQALHAADQATSLTRQLLLFSRRQVVQPVVVDVVGLVKNLEKMIRRLVGEHIQIEVHYDIPSGWLKIDPGQFEQVLVNLVVNARDAMPEGGILTLAVSVVMPDSAGVSAPRGVEGEYLLISVKDTGTGISEDVKTHLFEPFFTTKERGRGTGLGLATCYGVVAQSGGHIVIESEVGKGTIVKVWWPRSGEEFREKELEKEEKKASGGSETILLVEDEKPVQEVAARILTQHGYTVLRASDGVEALEMISKMKAGTVHLLLTDVVMPRMGGLKLVENFRRIFPQSRVVFMSGYAADPGVQDQVTSLGTVVIQKPFSVITLVQSIRQVLDRP